MIEVRKLAKTYGDRVGVADLSFTVQPGSVTGLQAPNSSAATTLARRDA